MTSYYVMESALPADSAEIGEYPRLDTTISWFAGRRIRESISVPLVCTLLADSGRNMPAFFSAGIPIMHRDLVDALQAAGVDNLQCYAAELVDPLGPRHTEYFAVNVVGVVAAADSSESVLAPDTPAMRMIDTDFDALAIDKDLPKDLLLFRLAQSVNALIAHERVRRAVMARGLSTVVFTDPAAWIG